MASKKKKAPASARPAPRRRNNRADGKPHMRDVHLLMPPKLIAASKRAAEQDAKNWSEWMRDVLWRAAKRSEVRR